MRPKHSHLSVICLLKSKDDYYSTSFLFVKLFLKRNQTQPSKYAAEAAKNRTIRTSENTVKLYIARKIWEIAYQLILYKHLIDFLFCIFPGNIFYFIQPSSFFCFAWQRIRSKQPFFILVQQLGYFCIFCIILLHYFDQF